MTLQQLRYFCVMTEVLHYTKAANLLYVSQPSLSYSLSELEKELGVPLFEKRGKQTHLTQFGSTFLPYAKRALSELSMGQERILEMANPTGGNINLGYIYSVSFRMMPDFVEQFYNHQGNRQIAFRFQQSMTGLLLENLIDGSLDVVISAQPDIDRIDYVPIWVQELFLAVPFDHRLAEREVVELTDLSGEKLISISHNTAMYALLDDCFKKADLRPQIIFEVDECSSLAAFVGSGAGVAIMPHLPVVSSYNVKLLPFADPAMRRNICLLKYKGRYMSPAVQSLWDFAKKVSETL